MYKKNIEMKVGILTHPLRTNYGGILQNYALHVVLKRMGHHVLTIDRHNDKSICYILISYIKRNIQYYLLGKKNISTSFYLNLTRKQFVYISKNIQNFINKYIETTHYISSNLKLQETLKYDFDAYIVGSDQIWNKSYAPSCFLDFLGDMKVLRIAYAASFGGEYWNYSRKMTEKCSKLASKFDAVSVREKSAVDLCRDNLRIDSTHVLDPTLLLDREDYLDLVEQTDGENKENILMCYILDDSLEKREMISYLCQYFNLNPLEIKAKESEFKKDVSLDNMVVPSISKWLAGFRDAKFVITDSFHGMIMAIIFKKQFAVIGNERRGIARFKSLLSQLNMLNRMVDTMPDLIHLVDLNVDIDYLLVDSIIRENRKKSMQFIEKSLCNNLK